LADIVDSYSEANQSVYGAIQKVHPSDTNDLSSRGQSLTGDGTKLYSCKFYLKVGAGSPGNLIARLYAHSGTFGTSSLPTGSALDSSGTIAASGIGGSFALVEFTGFSGYMLVDGTKYCIALEAYDGTWDSSNCVHIGADTPSPTHGGNAFNYKNSAWVTAPTTDLIFYVYNENVTVTPSTLPLNLTTYAPTITIAGTPGQKLDLRVITSMYRNLKIITSRGG